jgi:hypothetical protein
MFLLTFNRPTSKAELETIYKGFNPSKSPGYDGLSMSINKQSFDLIAVPLTTIINLSLSKGVFPDKLKIAKIIPVFKSDDPKRFTNYRPISLLPNFSKFYERVTGDA